MDGLVARTCKLQEYSKRWEHSAEHFQAVGTHLRECLISFAHEIAEEDDPVPDGIAPPKSNDVTAWVALLAKAIAPALPTHVCAIPQGIVEPTWDYQLTLAGVGRSAGHRRLAGAIRR